MATHSCGRSRSRCRRRCWRGGRRRRRTSSPETPAVRRRYFAPPGCPDVGTSGGSRRPGTRARRWWTSRRKSADRRQGGCCTASAAACRRAGAGPSAPNRTAASLILHICGGQRAHGARARRRGARLSAWLCRLVSAPARSAADGVAPRRVLQARRLHRRLGLPRRGGTGAGGAGGPCGALAAPQSGQLRASAARTILARCALGPAISQRPQRLPGTRSNART